MKDVHNFIRYALFGKAVQQATGLPLQSFLRSQQINHEQKRYDRISQTTHDRSDSVYDIIKNARSGSEEVTYPVYHYIPAEIA